VNQRPRQTRVLISATHPSTCYKHQLIVSSSQSITLSSLPDLAPEVAHYLWENVSPEDRGAVAELIQTTQQALGRASEALARIFLSLEASQVPELADQFLDFLRAKGLSRQRLSCIRIAARVRAELQASSRLDSGLCSSLLSLGDDLLQVYSRLPEAAQEQAHGIIRSEGRISRQQLRQLLKAQSSPQPLPAPGQSEASSGSAVVGGRAVVDESAACSEPVANSRPALVASLRAAQLPLSVVAVQGPAVVGGQSAASSDEAAITSEDLTPVPEAAPVSGPVSVLPPIRGVDDIRHRIRNVGLNSYQILMAALDVLENREVDIFQRHTNEQLERMSSIIDTLDREYRHRMR